MAKCDEGYLCELCGKSVDTITDSELYLRFVVGLLDPETLHTTQERHIRCNPTLAQFIVHETFPPIDAVGDFSKEHLDATYVDQQEQLLTRGWLRLQEIKATPSETLSILEYPLPEVQRRLREDAAQE
jgi:hypothetical protein